VADIHRHERRARAAKILIPHAVNLLSSTRLQSTIALGETAVALLPGKSSGSAWDIAAAAPKISSAWLPVFDVGANKGDWSPAIYVSTSWRRSTPHFTRELRPILTGEYLYHTQWMWFPQIPL
jgi:hypothetical protein